MSKCCSHAARFHCQGFFQKVHNSIFFEPPLVPFIDFAFRVKPVGQVAAGFATTLMPQFMRPLGDLFFQADVQIDV